MTTYEARTYNMEALRKRTKKAVKDIRNEDICLYFHKVKNQFGWCDKKAISGECKRFYKLRKEGVVTMSEENNGTIELEGKTFYYFVVQNTDEEEDTIDPLALANGVFVEGYVYFFIRSTNRDALYKYIMGIK